MIEPQQVTMFARLALDGLQREYPHKPSQVLESPTDIRPPQARHPVFFGNFDWHSSVHAHWMLVRLLRKFPTAAVASHIRTTLAAQLTEDKLQVEATRFVEDPHFERMYGWAWLLQLARELHVWDDSEGGRWRGYLHPLERQIVRLAMSYLPKLQFPIRVGTHTDTAFALAMQLDYARTVGDASLESLLVEKARAFYLEDRDYPSHCEPGGHDFFSSGFNEADLMRRVLPAVAFSDWLDQFLPQLRHRTLGPMITPVEVIDVTDGHLIHLAGLDLSRAWTMQGIASALPADDGRRDDLQRAIPPHVDLGLRYVSSGDYAGEHWLATFAVYHLTGSGLEVGTD